MMRNQYKVLSERYERVQEGSSDGYEDLFKRIIELSDLDKRKEFVDFLKQNEKRLFDLRGHSGNFLVIKPELEEIIHREFPPTQSDRGIKGETGALANYLMDSLYWGARIKKISSSKQDSHYLYGTLFDSNFTQWCYGLEEYKILKATQTQHTKTHGVDLSNL